MYIKLETVYSVLYFTVGENQAPKTHTRLLCALCSEDPRPFLVSVFFLTHTRVLACTL